VNRLRILGLDVGKKRIGVAISDPYGWTAQGLTTINRTNSEGRDIDKLLELIEKYQVSSIVVGLPKNMNGTYGPQAESIKEFTENLAKQTAVPINFWDERLTTVAAEKTLIEADVSRKKRKKVVDKVAAVFILQNYLEYISKQQK
jgi:putative Holliday junction resolvase